MKIVIDKQRNEDYKYCIVAHEQWFKQIYEIIIPGLKDEIKELTVYLKDTKEILFTGGYNRVFSDVEIYVDEISTLKPFIEAKKRRLALYESKEYKEKLIENVSNLCVIEAKKRFREKKEKI